MRLGEILRGGVATAAAEQRIKELQSKQHLSSRDRRQLIIDRRFIGRRRLLAEGLGLTGAVALSLVNLNPLVRAARSLFNTDPNDTDTSEDQPATIHLPNLPHNPEANPPSEFTFPEGVTIKQSFISETANFRRIIKASEAFAFANIFYPSRLPELKFMLPRAAATRTTLLAVRHDRPSALVMRLQFERGVYAGGPEPFRDPTFSSAFLIATRGEDAIVASSRPSIIEFEGKQFATPIRSIELHFPVSYTDLYWKDTIIVLNRGLLGHQPDRAIFLPVTLRLNSSKQ